ncbi:gastrula zinc finger protein XlCGF49.1-like [Cynoglossus semilaevis]|uniref:gastrula zinc finger protein XlCGF49.1-like n=1 Tax=Cynoglossus semilaevis TaxID=244447 RepID=UPI0007DCA16F|nr:gastrula zinc finger protein XlCGF49.1-like [Cynoglossus semilaevis]
MECRRSVEKKEPHSPIIKDEEEEVCIKQEEIDLSIAVKTEDEEEKPDSSLLYRLTECSGEHVKPETEDNAEDSCETEDSDDERTETSEVINKPFTVTKCVFWETEENMREKLSFPECGQRISKPDLPCLTYHNTEKRIIKKGTLMSREKFHTSHKSFRCSECGKIFTNKAVLTIHERVHTGEKPYTCPICGKKFSQRAHLWGHQKTHTGEKPFGCFYCEKRFVSKSNLKRHEQIH